MSLNSVIQTPQPLQLVLQPPLVIESQIQVGQGPSGPPGPIGPAGGTTISAISDIAISGHRFVCAGLNGNVRYASNADETCINTVLGITIGAALAGDPLNLLRNGEIDEPSWNWLLDLPIYLGLNGFITQTPPTSPSKFSLIVGFPLSATKVFFSSFPAIALTF